MSRAYDDPGPYAAADTNSEVSFTRFFGCQYTREHRSLMVMDFEIQIFQI